MALPKSKKYLFQKFIPNEFDWGILVANSKVVSAYKRYPKKGEFRNNWCNGAQEEFVSNDAIPEHIKMMAINANDALNLSWSRSDIVVHKDTNVAYLMEVNRFPGIFTNSTEISGAQAFLQNHLEEKSLPQIIQPLPVVIISEEIIN